jgi:hypothetical protein
MEFSQNGFYSNGKKKQKVRENFSFAFPRNAWVFA